MKPGLVESDYTDAAERLRCSVAAVRAVAEVESRGAGFLPNGRPKVLFERHVFRRYTGGRCDATHPHLSNRKAGGYGAAGAHQHERLEEAMRLDRSAALMACSWGRFQIMGFNFALAGFPTLQGFVNAMHRGEREHLLAFVEYVRHESLDDELRQLRWADFARRYNGVDYRRNQYDVKLARAYAKYAETR